MNTQTLTRQAIRRAQREAKKRGRALTKEEVLKLHVQTTNPRARVVFAVAGLGAAGIAAACHSNSGPLWVSALFAISGLWLAGFGMLGRKELLELELKKVTPGRVADTVLTNILDGLV